jgi:hypothetical protein
LSPQAVLFSLVWSPLLCSLARSANLFLHTAGGRGSVGGSGGARCQADRPERPSSRASATAPTCSRTPPRAITRRRDTSCPC